MLANKKAFVKLEGQSRSLDGISVAGASIKKSIVQGNSEPETKAIVMVSCIALGIPIGFMCPHVELMKAAIRTNLPLEIQLIEYSIKLTESKLLVFAVNEQSLEKSGDYFFEFYCN